MGKIFVEPSWDAIHLPEFGAMSGEQERTAVRPNPGAH